MYLKNPTSCWSAELRRFDVHALFYKMNPKVLTKIGEDFRKAAYLMGAGFVGMVISNDQISTLEGQVLFIWEL